MIGALGSYSSRSSAKSATSSGVDPGCCSTQPAHKRSVLIKALAGCGKSHAAFTYATQTYNNVLGVTPYNKQTKRIKKKFGCPAITFHRFKGENIYQEKIKREYDMKGVECLVVDELWQLTHSQWVKLWEWRVRNPEVPLIATGDPHQLEAIDDIVSNEQKLKYALSGKLFDVC